VILFNHLSNPMRQKLLYSFYKKNCNLKILIRWSKLTQLYKQNQDPNPIHRVAIYFLYLNMHITCVCVLHLRSIKFMCGCLYVYLVLSLLHLIFLSKIFYLIKNSNLSYSYKWIFNIALVVKSASEFHRML
jgi:hypothetical protein